MQSRLTEMLTKVCSEVLANMAFMFTDNAEPEDRPDDRWLEVTIQYFGAAGGHLRFLCPRDFAELLAANLLGTRPADLGPESRADDAVKEFMNIVCGQFITAKHGTADVYNLTIPRIRDLAAAPPWPQPAEDAMVLNVEGFRIILSYEAAAPAAVS